MDRYDVAVFGGGVAGVSAAIAAAEEGAHTVLIERLGWLGGMVTGAYVIALCGIFDGHLGKNRTVRGNFDKITDRAIKEGAGEWTKWNKRCPRRKGREFTVDPEAFKYVLDRLVIEAGVDLWLHTPASSLYPFATMKVDCTGDGLVEPLLEHPKASTLEPILPGEPVSMGVRLGGVDKSKLSEMPHIKLTEHDFRIDGWMSLNSETELFFDCMAVRNCYHLDYVDKTRAETEGRRVAHIAAKELRKYPGFEKCYLISTGPTLGNRKGRTVLTQYYLTDEDQNRRHEDSIAVAGNVMVDHGYMEIPYRCLLAKSRDNMLYAGRTFTPQVHNRRKENGNHTAYEIPRLVGPCIATGEAAGVAAAMCVETGDGASKLDVSYLQSRLEDRGAIVHNKESYT